MLKDIKLDNFNSIETFLIDLQKFERFIYALMWPNSLKIVLSRRIRYIKKMIF